jgi:hypothetical protein
MYDRRVWINHGASAANAHGLSRSRLHSGEVERDLRTMDIAADARTARKSGSCIHRIRVQIFLERPECASLNFAVNFLYSL